MKRSKISITVVDSGNDVPPPAPPLPKREPRAPSSRGSTRVASSTPRRAPDTAATSSRSARSAGGRDVRQAKVVPVMPTDFSALTRVTQLVAGLPGPWGFGGGWGLDLFLGKPTRAHKDVDVAILRRHQLAWQSGLTAGGWTLAVAHHGKLSRWADGQPIELPLHVVWGKNPKHDPDFIELLLNDDEDGQFVFRRESSVRLPLAQAFLPMRDGLVVLAPELILLYKAKSHANDENEHDFESALPALDPFRRAWLTAALGATHPGHPWISRLGRH